MTGPAMLWCRHGRHEVAFDDVYIDFGGGVVICVRCHDYIVGVQTPRPPKSAEEAANQPE